MERGRVDLNRSDFKDADLAFRNAIAVDPSSAAGYIFLTRALIGELPPNLRLFPDSEGLLPKAEQSAKKAVALAPTNAAALYLLGKVEYKLGEASKNPALQAKYWIEANANIRRALELDPNSFEANYEWGSMIFNRIWTPLLVARTQSGVKPGKAGRIEDPALRKSLRIGYEASIDDALSHTQRALDGTTHFPMAMRQMSALLRLRAMLQDDVRDYEADNRSADEWQEKADAIAARQRAANPPQGVLMINGLPSVAPAPPPH